MKRFCACVLSIIFLAACGGGGGSGESAAAGNEEALAKAGEAAAVLLLALESGSTQATGQDAAQKIDDGTPMQPILTPVTTSLPCNPEGEITVDGDLSISQAGVTLSAALGLEACNGVSGELDFVINGSLTLEEFNFEAMLDGMAAKDNCSISIENVREDITLTFNPRQLSGSVSGNMTVDCGGLVIATCVWTNEPANVSALLAKCS